jgi:hypothetical protein
MYIHQLIKTYYIEEIKIGYVESYTKMYELLDRFSKTQDSKLRVDQVEDVASIFRKMYEYEIIYKLEDVFIINNIDENTERGSGGFGSTGVK